jgi:hypothetical protein
MGGDSPGGNDDNTSTDEDFNDSTNIGGDDPTGNTGGQTDQGRSDPSSVSSNDNNNEDTSDSFDANMGLSNQEVNQALSSNLSQAAIDSARTDQSQSPDSQSFFASTLQPEPMDFNIIGTDQNPTAASRDLRQRADQGSFPNAFTPFGAAINALSKIGPQSTLNDLNRGFAPTYSGGQITGTTGTGFGMENIPSYEPFSPVVPTTTMPVNMDDGSNNNEPIIRRNPSDPVQDDPTDPPISDDLASNYLQNPFYLYSGQGNLYQPYGYAANTLVNLLRTRNLTQPQQAAANLGLFGNPGDFV